MVVVAVVAFGEQLEARSAVAEVKALHHAHALEQMHGAVDGGEVAGLGQGSMDLADGEGVFLRAKGVEDGLARAGHAAVAAAQPEAAAPPEATAPAPAPAEPAAPNAEPIKGGEGATEIRAPMGFPIPSSA